MSEKLRKIHEQALRDFDAVYKATWSERDQALNDRRFYSISGAQWEGDLGEQFENKPMLEVNKIHMSVIRIISEYRNNRITVDFVSKDGTDSEGLATTCDGLYRADEQDSVADEAYDNAFEEAVGGGFGAWRLRAEYEDEFDEENEYQRIRIEPVFDADTSVYFDINAKRQDKSDAKYAYIITSMTKDAYEDQYNDDPASWPKETQSQFDWDTPDVVYVAEYYKIEEVNEEIFTYKALDGSEEKYTEKDFEEDDELKSYLDAIGTKLENSRTIKSRRVHKFILSGGKVLKDCGYIAGKNIPIVPMYGKRWFIDNVERFMGHVRLAKDAQRLKNMQLSKLAEISAQSSVEKPILLPEQVAGHEMMWSEDNIKDYPYLLINPIENIDGGLTPAGPIGYTKPPQIPPALSALLQLTDIDMKEILGNSQNVDGIVSNISGKAVEMIQNKFDMQTYIYMSNMAKAIQRSGEIWLSMAKDVFVEEGRNMKTVGRTGEVGTVELMQPIINKEGKTVNKNDLSKANFDIAVEVGPSSDTKREALVRNLVEHLRVVTDPTDQKILSNLILMNSDGEGMSDVRDYYRKNLVKMGVIQPTEEEQQMMQAMAQNQQPSPQDQYLQAAATNEQAKAQKAQADMALNLAKAEETKAKTASTLAKMDRDDREQVLRTAEKIGQSTQQPYQ